MPIARDECEFLQETAVYVTARVYFSPRSEPHRERENMARIIVALAMLGGAAAQPTIDAVNPKVVEA